MSEASDFLTQMDEVLDTLQDASQITATFTKVLRDTTKEMRGAAEETSKSERAITGLQSTLQRSYTDAFDDMLLNGTRFSDALRDIFERTISQVYSAAVTPVTTEVGGLLGNAVGGLLGNLMPFAQGGAFSQGQVMAFAKGGVFDSPTSFPMRGGLGVLGEAGPEAIMPLTRGSDGKLGVRSSGGTQAINVTMNISTPDVQGFRKSNAQIAAQISRALRQGNRNT